MVVFRNYVPLATNASGPLTNPCKLILVVLHNVGRLVINGTDMSIRTLDVFKIRDLKWPLSALQKNGLKLAY